MSTGRWQIAQLESKPYRLADGALKSRLIFVFRWRGPTDEKIRRYKVSLGIDDSRANRRTWEERRRTIDGEIKAGTFDPHKWFGRGFAITVQGVPRTVGDMVRRWQDSLAGAGHARQTREQYEITVKAHINGDPIEGVLLSQLQKDHLLQYRSRLIEKKLKASTVNKVFARMRSIVNDAFAAGYIPRPQSPAALVGNLRNDSRIADPFTPDEILRILWACTSQHQRAFYLTLALTGMRPGECCGVVWQYLAFDARSIFVRQQRLGDGTLTERLKNEYARRDIEMFPPLAFALRELRPEPHDPKGAVFLNPTDGEPMNPSWVNDDPWRDTLEAAEVPYRTLYHLRHTYCTFMVAAGKATQWIAAQMGHANVRKVDTVYSRWTKMPNQERLNLDEFFAKIAAMPPVTAANLASGWPPGLARPTKMPEFVEESAPAGNRTRT